MYQFPNRPWIRALALAACAFAWRVPIPQSAQSGPATSRATLEAAADSVAAAFDTHQFVFIGSTHGGKKVQDFLMCLLSRPALQRRVTDVLVEWGNPVHQKLVDRYLLNLEDISIETLRPTWFDTDAPDL